MQAKDTRYSSKHSILSSELKKTLDNLKNRHEIKARVSHTSLHALPTTPTKKKPASPFSVFISLWDSSVWTPIKISHLPSSSEGLGFVQDANHIRDYFQKALVILDDQTKR